MDSACNPIQDWSTRFALQLRIGCGPAKADQRTYGAQAESDGSVTLEQAVCQLFAFFHLPSASKLPSIRNESWPAGLVMAVTDF